MATDAFSQQIVNLVRKMPDEAILALVKNQLGAVTGEAPLVPPAAPRRSRARARIAARDGRGPEARGCSVLGRCLPDQTRAPETRNAAVHRERG